MNGRNYQQFCGYPKTCLTCSWEKWTTLKMDKYLHVIYLFLLSHHVKTITARNNRNIQTRMNGGQHNNDKTKI